MPSRPAPKRKSVPSDTEPSPAVKKAMAAFHKRRMELRAIRVMPLSEMDTLTKMVICAARSYITAKDPQRMLPYLKKAIERFDKAHEQEMAENLLRAIFGKKGDVKAKPTPRMEYCYMCDGVGLMEGWNRRDGTPCPKCHGAAVLPVEPPMCAARRKR